MRKSIVAAVIAASAATAACSYHRSEDGGPTVSRNYQVGNFQKLEVAGPYEVEVRTGANPGVSARGGEKLLNQTTVEVQGDKLVIRPQEQHHFFQWGFGSRGKAHFTVTVPQLNAAIIAGSGDINIDKVQGNAFEGTVAGSGDLTVGTVAARSLTGTVAGSGDLTVAGKADSARLTIAGSGTFDGHAFRAGDANATIAGSGSAGFHSDGTVSAHISGSGNVTVQGRATCHQSRSGSGSLRCGG